MADSPTPASEVSLRDQSRKETSDAVLEVVLNHGGGYGQGVEYAFTMVHGQPPYPQRSHK